jgi:hypothetical protein
MCDSRGHGSAFSRRISPESCQPSHPRNRRGRGECRVVQPHPWPACIKSSTRRLPQVQPNHRHSPRDGVNAYTVLSSGNGLSCPRRPRDAKHHRELGASVAASGPHDFAVRFERARLARRSVHRVLPPTFVTIAKRPSIGSGMRPLSIDFGFMEEESFGVPSGQTKSA